MRSRTSSLRRAHGSAAACAIGVCAAGAVLLRLPFTRLGVGPDEGGYAFVAEQWAHGARLYGRAWVDRPQGLLIVYRLLLDVAHTAWAIRLGAVVFGCAITVLVGAIGWMLVGPRTGVASAAIYAVVGVAPHVQGFTFNAELAAAFPSTAAVASAVAWRRRPRRVWLLVAGISAGAAVLMKQSGFDGLIVAAAIVLAAPVGWRRRAGNLAVLVGGVALPLAASALDGWAVGWRNYWFAVVSYRLGAPSGASLDLARRAARLAVSMRAAEQDLTLVAVVALVGIALTLLRRAPWIPTLWLLAAFLGFNTAALYWPHYYVELIPPLSLLAGLAATSTRSRLLPAAVVAFAVLPVLLFVVRLGDMSRLQKENAVPYYRQYLSDQRVATMLRAHSRPSDTIYALDSEADLYFLAGRRSDFPYLWAHPLLEIPNALARLRRLLEARDRPKWLIVYRSPDSIDPSGRLRRAVDRGYRFWRTVPRTRVSILRARREGGGP